uniref:Uncharacterized protein n=1 Tax=Candidatus Kentrum sp. LFY TaxID=2126342 RepID=A0A450WJT3_9GAMM|nr:MAG: hypothetical protein BECKLFY1418C_GA0070996_103022 [Candidatus Kentron sp. LFY]
MLFMLYALLSGISVWLWPLSAGLNGYFGEMIKEFLALGLTLAEYSRIDEVFEAA